MEELKQLQKDYEKFLQRNKQEEEDRTLEELIDRCEEAEILLERAMETL